MSSTALSPYAGPFDKTEAYHLLRRSTFGVSEASVDRAVRLGLARSLDLLFRPDGAMAPPIKYDDSQDPNVALGETWIRAPYVQGVPVNNYRLNSVRYWLYRNFFEAGFSLERRMMLFFLNHFGASRSGDSRIVYNYYELLRRGVFGSFTDLVKDVTIDPLMLIFLDGRFNKASSPNENYARELLELFTIGKGPLVGPGDYTNYTEDDVRSLARALTGWSIRNHGSQDPELQPESYFIPRQHDGDTKALSHRFGGATIEDAGEDEYRRVVDLIFERPNAGDYLCRKLYRWFVYYEIDEAVEREVIQPMAKAFRESGYQIIMPLRLLLASQHFFERRFRGALIKSPLDEAIDITRGLGLGLDADEGEAHWLLQRFNAMCEQQEMVLTVPPSVAGYKPYHQEPLFNRYWINASTLQLRTSYARSGIYYGYRRGQEYRAQADLLDLIAGLDNPSDPNDLVRQLTARMLPVDLSEAQLAALKEVLIPGLPDFEWTVEYGKHLDDPGDEQLRKAVLARLHDLVFAIVNTAEFHLY